MVTCDDVDSKVVDLLDTDGALEVVEGAVDVDIKLKGEVEVPSWEEVMVTTLNQVSLPDVSALMDTSVDIWTVALEGTVDVVPVEEVDMLEEDD